MSFIKARGARFWRATNVGARVAESFAAPSDGRVLPSTRQVSQAELQHEVQRFAGRFADRVTQAAEKLADPDDLAQSEAALRRALLYGGNALEIATGALPELNLLDMLVFMTLVRDAFATHWQPHTFHARGIAMLDALVAMEAEAWKLAEKYLLPGQREQLREAIQSWRADHPEQYRVESVRLADFSDLAARSDRKRGGRSLLHDMRSATQAADEAVLLGERALFWGQRAPTLIRLQVRLGALEVSADAMRQLDGTKLLIERGGELLREVQTLAPVLTESRQLTHDLAQLCAQTQALIASARELVTPFCAERTKPDGPPVTVAEVLMQSCAGLGESLRGVVERAPEPGAVDALVTRGERFVRRTLYSVALVGVVWSMAFWLGYYLTHR